MNRSFLATLAAFVLCPALASAGGPPEPPAKAPTFAWGDRGPRSSDGTKVREDAHDIELRRQRCEAFPGLPICDYWQTDPAPEPPCPCDDTCNDVSCGAE